MPNGHSFVYHETAKTYAEAKRQCRAEGANLVVVDSAEKQDWFNKVAPGTMTVECGVESTR